MRRESKLPAWFLFSAVNLNSAYKRLSLFKYKAACKRTQHCWMLHVASVCTPCCMLLDVVRQSLKPVKLFSQQLPTFLLFRDHRSVAQQCWIRLQSSSNIVGTAHAHYAWFIKTYGLYPSHDALQAPTLLGVVASVYSPLPTCTQQLPTLLAQQYWELLRLFTRSLSLVLDKNVVTTLSGSSILKA